MKNINAVIMAAGLSSRFAPISYEMPKGLLKVKNEVLIERQICQLKEAGIHEIIIVTGYKKEMFEYLRNKYNVILLENKQYMERNNHESLYVAKNYIKDTFICSADNYFQNNVFIDVKDRPYYAAIYQEGKTKEWCLSTDERGLITNVQIGGENTWFMLGHVLFDAAFSKKFFEILDRIYYDQETKNKLWEAIYMEHLDELFLFIMKYKPSDIFEFDSLDELRLFDTTYNSNSNSKILHHLADVLKCQEGQLHNFMPIHQDGKVIGCNFHWDNKVCAYSYESEELSIED